MFRFEVVKMKTMTEKKTEILTIRLYGMEYFQLKIDLNKNSISRTKEQF